MNPETKLSDISDLALAGMIARSNAELQQVIQKKQMFENELIRREQVAEATAKKVADEMIKEKPKEEVKEAK